MKVAVIGGGGAWGAYTVGKMTAMDKEYDILIGCSTGSLISPLASLRKWDKLIEAYSNVSQENVFNVNPFDKNGKLKKLQSAWRIIKGEKTIGETCNLRKLIKRYFTEQIYNLIKNKHKEVIVTVCNLSDKEKRTEYKSINDYSYEEFVDYIWASANIPFISSLVYTKEGIFVDGGVTETLPLIKAIELGAKEIDCFIHRVEFETDKRKDIKNSLHLLGRLFNVSREEISYNDILTGKQKSELLKDVNINFYYLPYQLSKYSHIFEPEEMRKWIELGKKSV
ncbi:MAG: patatin-like phospholipase family protein [Nanoarchaeota archaeon]